MAMSSGSLRSFLWMLMSLVTSGTSKMCTIKTFHPLIKSEWNKGPLLGKFGPVSQKVCERTCRQYIQCEAYHMQWSDDRRIHGHCAVMKKVSRLGTYKSGVANATLANVALKSSLYAVCPDNVYDHYTEGRCYRVHVTEHNWITARAICEESHPGAHLVDILTAGEQQMLNRIASTRVTTSLWSGGHRQYWSGPFMWSGSENKPIKTFFWSGNHSTAGPGNCISFWDVSGSGGWRTEDCDERKPFICELVVG